MANHFGKFAYYTRYHGNQRRGYFGEIVRDPPRMTQNAYVFSEFRSSAKLKRSNRCTTTTTVASHAPTYCSQHARAHNATLPFPLRPKLRPSTTTRSALEPVRRLNLGRLLPCCGLLAAAASLRAFAAASLALLDIRWAPGIMSAPDSALRCFPLSRIFAQAHRRVGCRLIPISPCSSSRAASSRAAHSSARGAVPAGRRRLGAVVVPACSTEPPVAPPRAKPSEPSRTPLRPR